MSSAGPTDSSPSAAVEHVYRPSPPDAKLTDKLRGPYHRFKKKWAKRNKLGASEAGEEATDAVEARAEAAGSVSKRNKLGAVAIGVDDLAILFLNLVTDIPGSGTWPTP